MSSYQEWPGQDRYIIRYIIRSINTCTPSSPDIRSSYRQTLHGGVGLLISTAWRGGAPRDQHCMEEWGSQQVAHSRRDWSGVPTPGGEILVCPPQAGRGGCVHSNVH